MSRPISILLVEDSLLDADLAAEELSASGIAHRMRRVDTLPAFEAAIAEELPDVILSDYSLPEFDGRTALRIASQCCPDVPFIFVSGVIGEENAIESLKFGATDYVLKHRLQLLPPAVRRALNTARDRRERQRAQEALAQSEERLRLAVNAARMGTWELDQASGRIDASPICREHHGLAADTSFTLETLTARVHAEDRQEVTSRIQAALKRGGSFRAEYRVLCPDQTVRWIVAHGVALRKNEGAPPRMVGVTIDNTESKRVQEDLARQAQELTTLNADLRQFAYAASHDLKEPVRMVSVYAQLLAKRLKDQMDDEEKMFISFIETGTSRMSDLLRDLLTYLDLQTIDRETAPVQMDRVVQKVVRILDIAARESGARIICEPLPAVTGDASQLEQVLQNLIGNALKYRGERPPEIHISAHRAGSQWIFEVRDNGIGFDPYYAEQIFGLFKRLNHSEYPGTGLGLAICRRIVEHHGGKIWAVSEPGVGSVFSFSLPANTEAPAGTRKAAARRSDVLEHSASEGRTRIEQGA